MKNLKVSMKLLWPHAVALLLLVTGVIVSLVSFTNIKTKMEKLYHGSFVAGSAAIAVDESFEAMQTSIFRALLNESQDVADKAITDARNNMGMIEEQIAIIKQNTLEDKDIMTKLEKYVSELAPMQEHIFGLVAQKKYAQAAAYMESSNIPVIQEAQKELARFIQSADATKMELVASLQKTQRLAVIFLAALGAASVVFGIGAGAYIWRLQRNGGCAVSEYLRST